MWITELFQKLLPHLAAENGREYLLDPKHLKTTQIDLFRYSKLSPEQIIRQGDDDFLRQLCELKIELDALLSKGVFSKQQTDFEKLAEELNNVVSQDVTFSQAKVLRSGLDELIQFNIKHTQRAQRRSLRIRSITLVVTLAPLIGYGVHWFIAHYYQQALLEDVDFVYPESSYEFKSGIYQTRQSALESAIQDFQNYYFNEDRNYMPNPLPLAYNVKAVEGLGVKIDPTSELANDIDSGRANPSELSNTNFMLFRVFIRNIHENNIINHLRVAAEKIGENTFPWNRINVDSTIKFSAPVSYRMGSNLTLGLFTGRVPVVAVNLSISVESNDPGFKTESKHSIKMVRDSVYVGPQFDKRVTYYNPERPVLLYISPQRKEGLNLDPNLLRTTEQVGRDLENHADVDEYMKDYDYIYFSCPDGGLTMFSWPVHLQSLLDAKRVYALNVDYSYELLNGKRVSGKEKLPIKENNLILDKGIEVDGSSLTGCIGELAFQLAKEFPTAAMRGGWVGMADALALALMDRSKQASPVIAFEESLLFDFESKQQKLQKSTNDIHILKDGEYVLLNMYAINFEGGDYRFSFYFDDEQVGEINVNMLWPQSLKFKLGDEKYFRQTDLIN